MAFPSTPTRFTQTLPSDTHHLVDLAPAGSILAGRLLLLLFDSNDRTVTTPSGWTLLSPAGGYNNAGSRRAYVFGKITSPSDTNSTVDCVTNTAIACSSIVYYFPDEGFVLSSCVAAIGSAATGSSASPNPGSLTTGWGAVDALWIAGYSGGVPISAPASYTDLTNQTGYGLATAERQLNAASTDPGTFSSANTTWAAFTLAVRKAIVPTITSVTPDEVYDGLTGVVVAGTNYEASQGTGGVELADGIDYDTATKVAQTETAWGATSVTFTVSKGGLGYGTVYVFLTSNSGFRSAGFPITLIEPEPAPPNASAIAADMQVMLYDSGGNEVGAIIGLLEARITEGINTIDTATFTAPFAASGIALATVMREIGIQRIGEGEIFRGFIVKVGTPVDVNGVTIVTFSCLSLAFELKRRQTWRSVLLLDLGAQDGIDELLTGSGWTGTITGGGYVNRTKEFINQALSAAIGEFAETHQAYWRETDVGTRDVEVKNYHSPSGIILTNPEGAGAAGRYGLLKSIQPYDEDATPVVNRVSFEMKSDSARIITPQESSRTAPYPILDVVTRMARIVSSTLSLVFTSKVSQPFEMLGENRYAIALYVGPTGSGDSDVATIGGSFLETLGIAVNDVVVWGGLAPPKGLPVVDFESPAASVTVAGVLGLENVDQFNPVFGAASNSGTGTAVSVTVDSDTDCLVVAFVVLQTLGTPTVTPDNAEESVDKLSDPTATFDEDQVTAWQVPGQNGTTTLEWTISPSQAWEAFAIALRPAKLFYIEDAASQAAYGLSEEMLQLGTYNEVETNRTEIANAGVDAMVYFLNRRKTPPRTYGVEAVYLPGTPLDWRPGDTLRFLPNTTAVVDDERLICVQRTHSYDRDGVRTWELKLSDTPQIPVDELTLIAKLLGTSRAIQANQV